MNLIGKKVILRAMEQTDMELLRGLMNDPEVEGMVAGWSFPVSEYEQQHWYERAIADRNVVRLIIESRETGEAMGVFILHDIDWKNRSLSTAIKMKSSSRGKGLARDARFTVLKYLFEELNFHKINGSALDDNMASQAFTESCGSKREGIKREEIYKRGAYHDVILYGTLYSDYLEAAKKCGWLDD